MLVGSIDETSPTGRWAVILALGFAASAIAVVPNFAQLLHGNKVYLTVTCVIGLVGAIGGALALLPDSSAGVAAVMATMVLLWLVTTVHHSPLAKARTRWFARAANHQLCRPRTRPVGGQSIARRWSRSRENSVCAWMSMAAANRGEK